MNISKFLVSCFLAVSLVFAQSSKKSNPKEGASGSGSPKEKTVFDSLRGPAYNPYNTQGAATSIGDLFKTPSDIYGHKFFYISPTDSAGYAAFNFLGGSGLFGLDNSTPKMGSKLAALLLGYSTPGFGIALHISVAKMWESRKVQGSGKNVDASQRTTYPGDEIGFSFSLPIGSAKLYANANWLTDGTSWARDIDGDQDKLDISTITARAGLAGTAGSLGYDGYLFLERTGDTYTDINGDKYTGMDASLTAGLGVDLGYTALQSSNARVIVGLNNVFGMYFQDEIKGGRESDNIIILIISPNILAEVVLCENWLAFAGATHGLTLAFGDGDGNENSHQTVLTHQDIDDPLKSGTKSFVGIRWQKTSWALEAQVSKNPFEALNGVNTFANFGGWIYF